MTGEMTDRFFNNFIWTSFFLAKISRMSYKIYKAERVFYLAFYCSLVLPPCFTYLFQTGWNVDRWIAGRCATGLIGGRGLLMVDVVQLRSDV